MYDICALAIEILTKKSFDQVLREEFLAPLGMTQTSFVGVSGKDAAIGLSPRVAAGRIDVGHGFEAGTGPNNGLQ